MCGSCYDPLARFVVLFISDVYRFPDPPVHSVAFSIDHLGMDPVCDMVERDGVACDCRRFLLSCGKFADASSVNRYTPFTRSSKHRANAVA